MRNLDAKIFSLKIEQRSIFKYKKFLSGFVLWLLILFSLVGSFVGFANSDVSLANARSFSFGWLMSVNSVANSTTQEKSILVYSYVNPYLDYPNLENSYRNNPENTERLLQRISKYIDTYKSADQFDYGVQVPVQAELYLETSIKYKVPIEQMLAAARSESRFGTDCYTPSGNLSRICTYKNIFSIGLTESSSLGFSKWEDGVEAFGRLYKDRIDRGYDDCTIWRIYNPNGDYCAKILSLSDSIKAFLEAE